MPREPKVLLDGMQSALGGVDSGRAATLLDRNTLAFATNVSLRGGFPATRPRLSKHDLVFNDEEVESWFKTHRMQCAGSFRLPNKSLKIASVGGRLFAIDPEFNVADVTPRLATTTTAQFTVPAYNASVDITVSDATKIFPGYPIYVLGKLYVVTSKTGNVLTATNKTDTPTETRASGSAVIYLDPNAPTEPLAWMTQAEEFWIVQNGLDRAVIFNGTESRRAAPDEVPCGTMMVFNEEIGRLCVVVNFCQIAIGDIATGPTGPLKFTENTYLNEGGNFKKPFCVPMLYGGITGLAMVANLDRSNGQGAMVAMSRFGISTFNLPASRATWKDLPYPVQINMPLIGATSQAAIVQVNGDLYYRAPDGLRTLVYAVRDFTGPGNVPISSELARVLPKDDSGLLTFASGVLFDNRVIYTAAPLPSANGVYHKGLVTRDLDLISRSGEKAPAVFEGVWAGVRPTRLLTDGDRCFIFALNPAGNLNELWELHKESGFDNVNSRVVSTMETGAYDFSAGNQSNRFMAKKITGPELWVDQLVGQVDFLWQWKPDFYPCWFDGGAAQVCVAFEQCPEDDECLPWQTFNSGYATRIHFRQPPDHPEKSDFKPGRIFYTVQYRLVWTGQARIRAWLAKAEQIDEQVFPQNPNVVFFPIIRPAKPTVVFLGLRFFVTCTTPGAVLYVTGDGTDPTPQSGQFIRNANGGTETGGYVGFQFHYRCKAWLNGVASEELTFTMP